MASDSDSWTTPQWVWERSLSAMGRAWFDLDPCSNDQSTVPAVDRVCLPRDGLLESLAPGHLGWLNPPYSKPRPWFRWAAQQREAGAHVCGIVKLDPATQAWLKHGPDLAWVPSQRVRFVPPPGRKETSPNFVSALVLWSSDPHTCSKWARGVSDDMSEGYLMNRIQHG